MILLTASKMPEGLDKDILATSISLMFPNPDNDEYINALRDRSNNASAFESLYALALLYEQIRSLPSLPTDTSELIFARNKMGKPYFKNSAIKFNISHSKGYIACACAVGEELGVDIEASEITAERAERLAKRYFCDLETAEVIAHPEIFARKWTEKEARAKFCGESVEKILSDDRNNPDFINCGDICLHRFSLENIPVTLCTKSKFSTISFTVQ